MNEEGPLRKLVRWWRFEQLPQPPLPEPDPNCKHLKAGIPDTFSHEPGSWKKAWCPECEAPVPLADVFDNLLKLMREAAGIEEFKK